MKKGGRCSGLPGLVASPMAVLLRPVWFGRGPVARAHFIACPHADEILCTWCKRGDDVQVSLRCVIHLVWPQRQAVHVLLARVLVLPKQRLDRKRVVSGKGVSVRVDTGGG